MTCVWCGGWLQALTVGIFPYVIKLLQSPDPNLRHILVLVWARIMALDRSCQVRHLYISYIHIHAGASVGTRCVPHPGLPCRVLFALQNDLVNNNGHLYFISHLAAGPLLDGVPQVPPQGARLLAPGDYIWLCMKTAKGDYHRRGAPVINVPYATAEGESPPGLTRHAGDCIPFDQRVQAAFVLCMIMDGHRLGQHCCLQQSLHITIATHLHDPCPKLRFWQCLCLFKVRRRRGLGWACTARGLLPHHGRVWPMLRQLWENFEDARVPALMERLPDTLVPMLLTDASPEVRAGAAVALGALLRGDDPYVAPSRSVSPRVGVSARKVSHPRSLPGAPPPTLTTWTSSTACSRRRWLRPVVRNASSRRASCRRRGCWPCRPPPRLPPATASPTATPAAPACSLTSAPLSQHHEARCQTAVLLLLLLAMARRRQSAGQGRRQRRLRRRCRQSRGPARLASHRRSMPSTCPGVACRGR